MYLSSCYSPSSSILRACRFRFASSLSSSTHLCSSPPSRVAPAACSSVSYRQSLSFSSALRSRLCSVPRWNYGVGSRSPVNLRAQIRASSPVLERFERKIATMAAEHPFNGILSGLPKPGGGEYGKFYSLPALNDPRIEKLPYSIRILLESAIRNCDNFQVSKEDVEKIVDWKSLHQSKLKFPLSLLVFCYRILLEFQLWLTLLLCEKQSRILVATQTKSTHWFLWILSLITLFRLMWPDQKMLCRLTWTLSSRETMRGLLFLNGDPPPSATCLLFLLVLVLSIR